MRLEENEVLVRWPSVEGPRLESLKVKKRPGAKASVHNSSAPEKRDKMETKVHGPASLAHTMVSKRSCLK